MLTLIIWGWMVVGAALAYSLKQDGSPPREVIILSMAWPLWGFAFLVAVILLAFMDVLSRVLRWAIGAEG